MSKINKRTGKEHVDDYKYDHEILETKTDEEGNYSYDSDDGFVESFDYY